MTLAASLEAASEHPLAAALVRFAADRSMVLTPPDTFESVTGRGTVGIVGGRQIVVGSADFLQERNLDPSPLLATGERLSSEGKTPIYVAVHNALQGLIAVADPLKATSPDAIDRLQQMGLDVVMLTGDALRTANAVARAAGVAHVIAGVLPAGKVTAIKRLQEGGAVVAMVGDGINDAPALAQADVGIALGTGTDIAIQASDITVIRGDLRSVVSAITLSRRTTRIMRENLFWALVYNVVGIPIAAGALFPAFGILLSPILASATMALAGARKMLDHRMNRSN